MFWFLRKRFAPSLLTALLIVAFTCLSAFAQDLLVEPQSLDFGSVAISYAGGAETYRSIDIVNQSQAHISLTFNVTSEDNRTQFLLLKPCGATIRQVLVELYRAMCNYHQDFLERPTDIHELTNLGYYEFNPTISEEWTFRELHFNLESGIEATSTDRMPDGAGHTVTFDNTMGTFYGYGEVDSASLGPDEGITVMVNFQPNALSEVQSDLHIRWNQGQNEQAVPLHGIGVKPEMLSVSTHRLSFGFVSLIDRGRIEFTLANPSNMMAFYSFNSADNDSSLSSFSIHKDIVDSIQAVLMTVFVASQHFHEDFGRDPSSIEELQQEDYLDVNQGFDHEWTLSIIGVNPIRQIEAISTSRLKEGAGHAVIYDVPTRHFLGFGYGFDDNMDVILAPGREQTFIVEFIPNEVGLKDARFTITSRNEILEHISASLVDSATISLSGNGVLAAPPADNAPLPQLVSLSAAYPNPFNSSMRLDFSLPAAGWVKLELFDLSGRAVWTGMDGMDCPGKHSVTLDGAGLAAGVYMLRLKAEDQVIWRKVALVR